MKRWQDLPDVGRPVDPIEDFLNRWECSLYGMPPTERLEMTSHLVKRLFDILEFIQAMDETQ